MPNPLSDKQLYLSCPIPHDAQPCLLAAKYTQGSACETTRRPANTQALFGIELLLSSPQAQALPPTPERE